MPQQNGYKVLSQNSSSTNMVQVKDLLVEQQGGWNQTLLDNHFYNFEKEHINQLPLIKEDIEDIYMWLYTKDGNYTVKSSYNIIREWHHNREQRTFNSNASQATWKKEAMEH